MGYQLLDAFRGLFEGKAYLHRKSNLGDSVAMHLYEDLYSLPRAKNFVSRVDAGISVLNTQNRRHGIKAPRQSAVRDADLEFDLICFSE